MGLDESIEQIVSGVQDFGVELVQVCALGTESLVTLDAALDFRPFRRPDVVAAPVAILRDDENGGGV